MDPSLTSPPPTRTSYQYAPLDPNAHEIRLLALLPGSFTSKIRVSLAAVPFTEDVDIEFEALLHTWGSRDGPVDIFVGEIGQDALSVTKNLAEFHDSEQLGIEADYTKNVYDVYKDVALK